MLLSGLSADCRTAARAAVIQSGNGCDSATAPRPRSAQDTSIRMATAASTAAMA